jgi:hypothetical protein
MKTEVHFPWLEAEQDAIDDELDRLIAEAEATAPEDPRRGKGGEFAQRLRQIKRRMDAVTNELKAIETIVVHSASPMGRRS